MDGPDTGHVVYFIVASNFVKVGYSNYVWSRLRDLQTANPYELILAHTIGYDSKEKAMAGEKKWRARLLQSGKAACGEWVEMPKLRQPLERTPIKLVQIGELVERRYSSAEILEEALARYGMYARIDRAEAA